MTIPLSANASSRPAYRRRLLYVDSSIQRSLMAAMVVLEVALVAAATSLAYWHLNRLIEESLYRVHLVPAGQIFSRLLEEGFAVLGLFAAINVIGLLIAEGIWRYHENFVLRNFTRLIGKTRELDFSSDPETRRQHEVLALALAWRARERTRFAAIRDGVARLEAAASAAESPEEMRVLIESLNKLLP